MLYLRERGLSTLPRLREEAFHILRPMEGPLGAFRALGAFRPVVGKWCERCRTGAQMVDTVGGMQPVA